MPPIMCVCSIKGTRSKVFFHQFLLNFQIFSTYIFSFHGLDARHMPSAILHHSLCVTSVDAIIFKLIYIGQTRKDAWGLEPLHLNYLSNITKNK